MESIEWGAIDGSNMIEEADFGDKRQAQDQTKARGENLWMRAFNLTEKCCLFVQVLNYSPEISLDDRCVCRQSGGEVIIIKYGRQAGIHIQALHICICTVWNCLWIWKWRHRDYWLWRNPSWSNLIKIKEVDYGDSDKLKTIRLRARVFLISPNIPKITCSCFRRRSLIDHLTLTRFSHVDQQQNERFQRGRARMLFDDDIFSIIADYRIALPSIYMMIHSHSVPQLPWPAKVVNFSFSLCTVHYLLRWILVPSSKRCPGLIEINLTTSSSEKESSPTNKRDQLPATRMSSNSIDYRSVSRED